MKSHRRTIISLILCLLLSFSGCGNAPNTDPEPYKIPGSPESCPFDVILETDYSNITVETEFPSYSKDVDEISYTLTNNNVARGFYFYFMPYIEKYQFGEWVRLSYYPPEYENDASKWHLCALEGNTTDKYSTLQYLDPEYVSPKMTKGKYRLVVFVGDQIAYAEFEITD